MSDLSTLQAIVGDTEAQLTAVANAKAQLLSDLAALTGPDVGSISQSGTEGSESYTIQTLTEKIEQLSRVEATLTDTLEKQKRLVGMSGPGVYRGRSVRAY